jgi:hypothetical protein
MPPHGWGHIFSQFACTNLEQDLPRGAQSLRVAKTFGVKREPGA